MIGVLIVDDDPLTVELHSAYVERLEGFRVDGVCGSARAAVTALTESERSKTIDLVLLDVTMPDGTGVDVMRHVRSAASPVDVIAITGVRDVEVIRHMVSLGVGQYLVKPFTFAVFRERLEHYRDFRNRAERTAGKATQAEIDALLDARRPAARAPLPKGLSADTLERVSMTVRSGDPMSATEAAARLGMSRVAARRYLEHLADIGCVTRFPRYGTPGRPETEYRWSP